MKVGDLVGFRETWSDEDGLEIAGLVICVDTEQDPGFEMAELLMKAGEIKPIFLDELEVIYNGN